MADKPAKPPKEPGKIKQLLEVYKMTAKVDKNFYLSGFLAFIAPLSLGIVLIVFFFSDNPLSLFLWSITTIMMSALLPLTIMSRRAEKAAFQRISGQPGAVGAVLNSTLKRGYSTTDMPVAVDPKSKDAVYRAVGKAGVVLIVEGNSLRVRQLAEEERRKALRAVPGVTVPILYVNSSPEAVPLYRLTKEIYRLKKALTRSDISVVNKRLGGLGLNLPIPKGIDPSKVRPGRRI